jgi:inosine/xanthosine triphosphatase
LGILVLRARRKSDLKIIVLASRNPVKLRATLGGLQKMFPDEEFQLTSVSASSGVKSQPLSDAETLEGALNRARNAVRMTPNADYWVGIEGGVEETNGEMAAFAWVVVCSQELIGKGRTGTFFSCRLKWQT